MAVGDGAKAQVQSYVAVGKESTYGTYASATSAVEALSVSFKTEIESRKLEAISFNRGFSKRVQLNKSVAGTLEEYLHPEQSLLLVANAMGGPVVSNSLTSAADHSITSGNFDTSTAINSLSFNIRKGDTHVWRYSGGKVNVLKITAAVGEPIRASYDVVFKDSTQVSDDIASSLSVSAALPWTFVDGTFRYAGTEASLTSTAVERIQGFELTIDNGLKPDDGRELGANVLRTLPATRRNVEFKVTQRFDTTTAWDRFIQATQGAAELFFQAGSITSEYQYELTIVLPKLYNNTPDPELSGAEDILSSEIVYDCLVDDPNTTTGADVKMTWRNSQQSI